MIHEINIFSNKKLALSRSHGCLTQLWGKAEWESPSPPGATLRGELWAWGEGSTHAPAPVQQEIEGRPTPLFPPSLPAPLEGHSWLSSPPAGPPIGQQERSLLWGAIQNRSAHTPPLPPRPCRGLSTHQGAVSLRVTSQNLLCFDIIPHPSHLDKQNGSGGKIIPLSIEKTSPHAP